jgi:hypothetical protein
MFAQRSKEEIHDSVPEEMTLSWNAEAIDTMHCKYMNFISVIGKRKLGKN